MDVPGGVKLSFNMVTGADGLSNTLLMAHKFVQPRNYGELNSPPQSAYDVVSTVDAGWAATEGVSGGVHIFQPSRPAAATRQTTRSNHETHRLTTGMLADANHDRSFTSVGGTGGWPARKNASVIQVTGFEGIHGGPHPGASPCVWGDGSVRSVKYGLPGITLCAPVGLERRDGRDRGLRARPQGCDTFADFLQRLRWLVGVARSGLIGSHDSETHLFILEVRHVFLSPTARHAGSR